MARSKHPKNWTPTRDNNSRRTEGTGPWMKEPEPKKRRLDKQGNPERHAPDDPPPLVRIKNQTVRSLGSRYKGRIVQLRCDCGRCHDSPWKRKNHHASKQVRAMEKVETRREIRQEATA